MLVNLPIPSDYRTQPEARSIPLKTEQVTNMYFNFLKELGTVVFNKVINGAFVGDYFQLWITTHLML